MSGANEKSVLIVGGGLGGLSAAIHLRLAGFRVSVFEAGERVGGRANMIERDGFRFDTGPSLLNYPWVFEQLFAAANRNLHDYVKLLPVDPSVSFQWADGTRFTLSSDLRKFLEECERLEPGSRPAALAFMRDAAAKYRIAFEKMVSRNVDNPLKWLGALRPAELRRTSIWRSLDGELRRYFKSRHLREALGSYAMYLGGSPHTLAGMFTILSYGEMAYGLWLPEGGVYGLVEGIEKLAVELGVEIHTNCRVRKIRTESGRVTGLELADGSFRASSLVVSNVDAPTTDTELVDANSRASHVLRQKATRTKMTPGVVTFYWGVSGGAEVAGLGHHTIFLPEDYRAAFDDLLRRRRIPRELPFYVSVPSATDRALAPAGDAAVFVLVPVPVLSALPETNWDAVVRDVRAKVFETFSRHRVNLTPERILFEEVYTPAEWRRRFGLYDGSAFGAAHNLAQLGPLRHKNFSPEIEGLYYAGASTTPGTGMPMVVLGGQQVAERIVSHVR
ncbi:MAG TPA: phytoene desaturase family protein [Pyrinomonadaceae bacterium]|nr:phytoene desaturase family protein [Pyrinomonadaceae bacterium]